VVILLYSFSGMAIGLKKKRLRVNSFVLAIYPFVFHCCFLVFYWVESLDVLALAQLVCLTAFLIGSIHHTVTLIFEIVSSFVKMVRELCKSNRVEPEAKPKKKEERRQSGSRNAKAIVDKGTKTAFTEKCIKKANFKPKTDRTVLKDQIVHIRYNNRMKI
jgi:hypothetical protein